MATVKFKKTNYTTEADIIAFPEHVLSIAFTFEKDDAAATTVDGRKIVKAGTIYTYTDSNGDTKTGIVRKSVDVTDGNQMGAIVRHGWVRTNLMPTAPNPTQKAAMPLIEFV